jgi:hypothetical protein
MKDWRRLTREERTEALDTHCHAGMSASTMVEVLVDNGILGATRNSIIGHWARYGRPKNTGPRQRGESIPYTKKARPPKVVPPKRLPRRIRKEPPEKTAGESDRLNVLFGKLKAPGVQETAQLDHGGFVPLENLHPDQCRFPKWGHTEQPSSLFCGDPVKPGSSYCPHHHSMCWVQSYKETGNARKRSRVW